MALPSITSTLTNSPPSFVSSPQSSAAAKSGDIYSDFNTGSFSVGGIASGSSIWGGVIIAGIIAVFFLFRKQLFKKK